jgi:hypothetical protein
MKYILISLLLTGCAHPLQIMADYYDKKDPCQMRLKPADHQMPSWCGAGSNKIIVRDYSTNRPIAVIQK